MDSADRIYRGSVRALSLVFIGLGLVILARTFLSGGGALSVGAFLGVVFVAVGVGRLWLSGFFRDGTRGQTPS